MLIPWRRARVATKEDVPQIPREIWVLVIGAFIIALGFGLIAPVLPQYARSFDVSVFAASFVVSSFSIMRLIFAPTSGKLVDKFGGRRTYLIGLLIVAGSTLLVAAAQNYWQLLFFRAAGGIGSTMFTVAAMGLIVRIAPPEIRGRCSAAYGSAFLLGNVFGPLLGAAMAPLGMRVPFVVYGVALVIATAVVWRMLQSDAGTAGAKNAGLPVLTFREALTDSAYRASLVSGFANGWSNFGVRVAIVPLFAAAAFTNGAAVAGLALTFFAAGNVVALQFSGRLADSIGRKPILVIGLIINGIFTAVLGFMHGDIAVMAVSAIAGFGAGMINPAQQATVSDIVGNERQGGKVFSSYQMAQDLGAISGPLIVGLIVDLVGYEAGFVACGLITAVALVAWLFGRETWEGKRVKPEALEDSK